MVACLLAPLYFAAEHSCALQTAAGKLQVELQVKLQGKLQVKARVKLEVKLQSLAYSLGGRLKLGEGGRSPPDWALGGALDATTGSCC